MEAIINEQTTENIMDKLYMLNNEWKKSDHKSRHTVWFQLHQVQKLARLIDPTWLNIVEVEAESSLTAVQCFSQEELTMSILYYVEAIALQTPALHFTITYKAIGIWQ